MRVRGFKSHPLLLLLVLASTAIAQPTPGPTTTPDRLEAARSSIEAVELRPWVFEAELIRVVDGDTADFEIRLGFQTFIRRRVRFEGFDAPERRTPAGILATAAVSRLLGDAETIILTPRKEGALMSLNRIVSPVWVDGRPVAEIMRRAGHIKPEGEKRR